MISSKWSQADSMTTCLVYNVAFMYINDDWMIIYFILIHITKTFVFFIF